MLQKSNLAKNPCISRVFCYFRSKNDVCKTVQLFWSLYDLNLRQLSRKYGQITVNHTHYTEWLLIRRETAPKTVWHWPLPVYSHPPFRVIFFDSEVISLSKYESLWRFLWTDRRDSWFSYWPLISPLQTGSRTIWIPCRENFTQRKMGAFCPHCRTVTSYLC